MRKTLVLLFVLIVSVMSAVRVPFSVAGLPEDCGVVSDLNGDVNVAMSDFEKTLIEKFDRELPVVFPGFPVSYNNANTLNGAIYTNMDDDNELELLFGVGKKIVALNTDGTAVQGWPVNMTFYIWGSPSCGDIDGDGEDEIVCTSRNNTNGNTGELYAFRKDGTAVEGFPVVQSGGGTLNSCLADINGDGTMEILVNIRNSPQGWVYVYNGSGEVVEGWPQELDTFPGASISVGDIDGDGNPEVIALSYQSLFVYDTNGNLLEGFPVSAAGFTYSYSSPVLVDLDNNGTKQIVYGGCSDDGGAVFVVNPDGSFREGWPVYTDSWIFATVSVGDIDADGNLDLVVGDQVSAATPSNFIYAWDKDGVNLTGFPTGPVDAVYTQIAIADIDGDGLVELIVSSNAFAFGYDCYNHDGTHNDEWPLAVGTGWDSVTMQSTAVIGDFDGNGYLDIAGAATGFSSWIVECYLWQTNTLYNEELAYMIINGCNNYHDGAYENPNQSVFFPPSSVTVQVENYNDVNLDWEMLEISDLLTGYNVYLNDELISAIDDIENNSYSCLNLAEGNYIYYVTAVYGEVESLPSEEVSVSISLLPPVGLTAELLNENSVSLTWEPPSNSRWLSGYELFRNDVSIAQITENQFIDEGLTSGLYQYYLIAVYGDELFSVPSESVEIEIVGSNSNSNPVGFEFSLFPNPFGTACVERTGRKSGSGYLTIFYKNSKTTEVAINVFNIKGEKIRNLATGAYKSGEYNFTWDGRNNNNEEVSSGIYFV
ncbi:MAG: FG-GAP-like repeat-containing protein, partial [Candidatus Cloacimonetes bacterium]|nr:FG-GAP-like repeat-containing protein [Candidatus Cloacimonadota bacterium]